MRGWIRRGLGAAAASQDGDGKAECTCQSLGGQLAAGETQDVARPRRPYREVKAASGTFAYTTLYPSHLRRTPVTSGLLLARLGQHTALEQLRTNSSMR